MENAFLLRLRIPERDPDARHEFGHAERLHQVVIGARIERGDLVAFVLAGRDDEDGCPGPFPEAARDLHTGHVRNSKVQQDHVRRTGRRGGDHLAAVSGDGSVEALLLNEGDQRGATPRVIVGHEDANGGKSALPG
jgi:hypothetical protein